jgi:hypothetical protein
LGVRTISIKEFLDILDGRINDVFEKEKQSATKNVLDNYNADKAAIAHLRKRNAATLDQPAYVHPYYGEAVLRGSLFYQRDRSVYDSSPEFQEYRAKLFTNKQIGVSIVTWDKTFWKGYDTDPKLHSVIIQWNEEYRSPENPNFGTVKKGEYSEFSDHPESIAYKMRRNFPWQKILGLF